MKQFIKLKEIPGNGVDRCMEIAPNDLLMLQMLFEMFANLLFFVLFIRPDSKFGKTRNKNSCQKRYR